MTTIPDKLDRLERAIQQAKALLVEHGGNTAIDTALETAVALLDSIRRDVEGRD